MGGFGHHGDDFRLHVGIDAVQIDEPENEARSVAVSVRNINVVEQHSRHFRSCCCR